MKPQAQVEIYRPGMYVGSRPLRANRRTGQVLVQTGRGMMVNSQLLSDEWQQLDAAIQMAAVTRLIAVGHLRQRGLVKRLGSLGILTTQWSQASEMTAAAASMSGQSEGERDRVEFSIAGSPVPVVHKEFMIPARQLEASRLGNSDLDTSTATAATRVVAEKLENMLIAGDASVIFGGNTLVGYTTEANRNTDTATNYGGGDWSTISNIIPTIEGMINAAVTDRYYGPYFIYAAATQYNEATLKRFSDGSGEAPADFIRRIPAVEGFFPSDDLTAGHILLVQMTEDVVKWAEHMDIAVVEWMSGDGLVGFYKVMAVATPEVKSDYNSRSGIVHATGA